MADFTISGQLKIGTLKKRFKESFGSTLRVYKGPRFADDDLTVAQLSGRKVPQGSEVSAHGNTKVAKFEQAVLETYGIKVQVSSPDDSKLVKDDITLSSSGKN